MCLARAYAKKSDQEVMLADSIARIFLENGKVKMYDIFGDETVVDGQLLDMDLERSIVKIALTGEK